MMRQRLLRNVEWRVTFDSVVPRNVAALCVGAEDSVFAGSACEPVWLDADMYATIGTASKKLERAVKSWVDKRNDR